MNNDTKIPWHKRGTKLDKPQTARLAICSAGMNWTVAKVPQDAGQASDPQRKNLLVREDLWDKTCGDEMREAILSEVTDDYVPLQNTHVFDFFDPVVATGAIYYDSAGFSDAGKHIWLMARLPGDLEIVPGDKIGCFLQLSYSHEQFSPALLKRTIQIESPSIRFSPVRLLTGRALEGYFSSVRVLSKEIQANQIIPVLRSADGRPSLDQDAEAVMQTIRQHYEKIAGLFRSMARLKMDEAKMQEFVESLFLQPLNMGDDEKYEKSMAKRLERMRRCSQFIIKGNEHPEARGTLWAAYNAVIEYNAHCRAEQEGFSRVSSVVLFLLAKSKCEPQAKDNPFNHPI